jgi:beta-lactam-binding protein with PASTA domain
MAENASPTGSEENAGQNAREAERAPANAEAKAGPPNAPASRGAQRGAASGRQANAVRHRVWTAGRLLLLAGGLGLTFGVFFLTSFAVATRAREVRVPDVRGKSLTDATAALSAVGLAASVDPVRRADAKVPADHVLSQEPDPGNTLRRQRPVLIRVSDGQRDPVVPTVIGQADQAATAILTQSGITVAARIDVRTADSPVGAVVAQDPPAKGRAQAVTLLINRGLPDQAFVMPDLIGTIGAQAADVLRSHSFRVAPLAIVAYPGLPSGVVVRQTPQAGYRTAQDELIVLEVSR